MKRLTLTEIRDVLPRQEDLRDIVDDSAQMFDFGTETSIDNDVDLIADLWHKKLLQPPFPRSVFTFRREHHRIYLCAGYGVGVSLSDKVEEDCTVLLIITQFDTPARRQTLNADAVAWFKAVGDAHISAGATPLSECDGETEETFRNFTLWCIGRFMRLCMLLNTKGVPRRHEPVPHKLNEKRARSGKPPISAVTYVDLTRVLPTDGTGAGTPKSMHFRRGHIRRYNDGSVSWVRDCIVKADGDLKKRERYQVGELR